MVTVNASRFSTARLELQNSTFKKTQDDAIDHPHKMKQN